MEITIASAVVILFVCGFIYLKTHKVKKVNSNGGGGSNTNNTNSNESQTT